MNKIADVEKWFDKSGDSIAVIVRVILYVLLVVICFSLAVGVLKSGIDLVTNLGSSSQKVLQQVLLDAVFVVALVEITIAIIAYLRDGHVHVRYIVDIILIIMLNEVIAMWFKEPDLKKSIGLAILLLTLAAVRVSVIKYGPSIDTEKPKA